MEDYSRSKEELINESIYLRKRIAELEQKYNFELDQEVNKRTAELLENNEMLKSKKAELEDIQLKEKLAHKTMDKYLKLFNSIDQGFLVIDVIFDENDKPIDMYYVEANEASIKILGMDLSNRYLKDIDSPYISYWFEIFAEVALTGKSVRLEDYAEIYKKWYSSYTFKIGDENSHTIGNMFLDITERKRMEQALKDSEENLRTILENTRDGISMLDLKTEKYLYLSPSQEELTGITKEEINNLSLEEAYKRVHPDDLEIAIEQRKIVAAGLETFRDVEFRWKVKNGEYRWFSNRRKLVRDENGQPIAIVGTSRDITDQKEYENKLALQAKILSNINDSIIVVDENDIVLYCNKAFIKLFGWPEHEMIGHSIDNFSKFYVDEETKEKHHGIAKIKQKYLSTDDGVSLNGIKHFIKDGTQIIADINIAVLRGSKGEYKGLILSIRDVSERHKYQLELKNSEEKYRYLYNSIDEGLAVLEVIFDKDNKPKDFRFIELNPAYERISGLINKNLLGKTAKELKLNFDDFWYERYGEVALTGEPMRFIHELKTLNIWLDAYVFKFDLENDNKIGVLFNDITEEVMHNNKIEEFVKLQDELYVNVSHELKTPLNVIFSANQLMDFYLRSDSIEDKKEKLYNYNNNIKQNCYRLTKLINNIVDLSKSNSGLLNLNLCNVDIVDVVESIVQSVSEYVKSKGLRIIFDTNIEKKVIACDPDKIERVMLNLISNAIKFSNPKGVIFVNVISKGEIVEISVMDTGKGIEKQNLFNIFNRFYQEDKSLSRNAECSGIGLSLVKSLVEMHAGNIRVESEVNKGSVFKVELPARTTETQELKEQTHSYSNKIETIKIEFSDVYSIY